MTSMDKAVKIGLFSIVLLVLVLFMTTYTVRYDQYVIVTTFGKVTEASHAQAEGLHFKLPTPIQRVRRFDRRIRVFETRAEDHQTRDLQQITLKAFLTWRISDPVQFFKSYSGARADTEAEKTLDDRLRAALGSVSEYEFGELLARSAELSKLMEFEEKVLSRVRKAEGSQLTLAEELGVEVMDVGISRILLPQTTTRKVFERMKAGRESLAADTRARGRAEAGAIRAEAEAHASMIRAFARSVAAEIRAKGEQEAKQWLALMADDQELAVYIRAIDALKDMVSKQVTLIVSKGDYPFNLLSPQALEEHRNARGIPAPAGRFSEPPGTRETANDAAEGNQGTENL
jgi:membrane protease subunit HflC